jgi:hypothetical protein
MKTRVLQILSVLLLMYVSLRLGAKAGATKTFDGYLTQHVGYVATETNARVKVLEQLKAGNTKKAEELLENLMDNDIGFLGVIADNKHITDKSELMAAIRTAKAYRAKYPDHHVSPTMKGGVDKAFRIIQK